MPYSELLAPFHFLPETYVVIDTETTGLFEGDVAPDPVTLGVVRIDKGKVLSRHEFKIRSTRSYTHNAQSVHSIASRTAHEFPKLSESWPAICELTDSTYVVAYNALFDWRVLVAAGEASDLPPLKPHGVFCAQRAAQPWAMANGLECTERGPTLDAVSKFLGLSSDARHSAIGDAFLAHQVIARLRARFKGAIDI